MDDIQVTLSLYSSAGEMFFRYYRKSRNSKQKRHAFQIAAEASNIYKHVTNGS